MREKVEPIPLLGFFKEMLDYFHSRFERKDIEGRLKLINANNFVVSMNKGKLVQVIDNILLNSEYWLREELRLKRIEHGIITVDLSKPFVRISDNGRGGDPSIENSLFEPFVTKKGKGKGRGLGLFIVRQLLDSEGCAISLLPKRNHHNRLYIFEINFTEALHGSEQKGSDGNR
jgi:signal transduction histidine kinase